MLCTWILLVEVSVNYKKKPNLMHEDEEATMSSGCGLENLHVFVSK